MFGADGERSPCGGEEGEYPHDGIQASTASNAELIQAEPTRPGGGGVGFSSRIHDPAFVNCLSNSSRQAAVFSFILAAVALVGFSLAGVIPGSSMRHPQALLTGLAVSSMFTIIGLKQIQSGDLTRTWDGKVVDKRIEVRRGDGDGGQDCADSSHRVYTVVFLSDSGRTHQVRSEEDGTRYDYFSVGDRVRYHGGLDSFEKYDKSRDTVIICNACGAVQPIALDYCRRCRYPLLK